MPIAEKFDIGDFGIRTTANILMKGFDGIFFMNNSM